MNCIKCKHLKIKFNENIKNADYCAYFKGPINIIKEKIETKKLNCFEEGENDITEFWKKCADTYFESSRKF